MKTKLLTFIATLALTASMQARTINWGSASFDRLFTSTGAPLDDSFTFELGTFGTFVPTEFNMSQWEANWRVFDRATAANGKWNSASSFFESYANLNDNGTSSSSEANPGSLFAQGEQAYIWTFNTLQLTHGLTEWALVTNNSLDSNSADDWKFPPPTDHSLTPLEWRIGGDPLSSMGPANDVPFGGVNSQQGPGSYTADPQPFDLQTHTLAPEPGSALLIGMLGLLVPFRRRR